MKLEPLKDYQIKTIEHIHKHPVNWIGNAAGLGKTRCEIESWGKDDWILYICPAHLIPNVRKEIRKWRPDFERQVGLFSYTYFSRAKDRLHLPFYNKVVLDECTAIKNIEAKCTMVILHKVLPAAKNGVSFVSASPIQKSGMDLYPMVSTALPDKYSDPVDFGHTFSNVVYDPYKGGIKYEGINLENVAELRAVISTFGIKFTKQDVAKELPPIIEDVVHLEPSALPAYDINTIDVAHLTKDMLSDYQKLGVEKIPYVLDAIESNPDEPTLIGVHHRAVNEAYVSALKTLNKRVGQIIGGTTGEQKQAIVDLFESGKLDYLVVSFDAGGQGLNCPRASRVMLAELPTTYVSYYQFINRAHRLTTVQTVYVLLYALIGTFDSALLRIRDTKKDSSDQVIGKIDNVIKKDKTNGRAERKTKKDSRSGATSVCATTETSTDNNSRNLPIDGGECSSSPDVKKHECGESTGPTKKRGRPRKGGSSGNDSGGSTASSSTSKKESRSDEGKGDELSERLGRYSLTVDDLGLSLIGEDDLGLGFDFEPDIDTSTRTSIENTKCIATTSNGTKADVGLQVTGSQSSSGNSSSSSRPHSSGTDGWLDSVFG